MKYRLSMPGKHWALNSVGVLAAAHAMGADLEQAAASLVSVTPPKGRGQIFAIRLDDGTLTVTDETYNASPVAMRAAFNVLASQKPGRGGRRIVVLGDMLELGDDNVHAHLALADDIKAHDFDQVFACGQYMSDILDALPQDMQGARAATSQQLAAVVATKVRGGDLVMVKGSAGSHMGHIIEALKALGPLETGSV
jgi:UDP-N-acetylmuramoyl-tripeptide--D-alanyl-D-alanine ligase